MAVYKERTPSFVEATQWNDHGDHDRIKVYDTTPPIGYLDVKPEVTVEPGDWIVTDEYGDIEVYGNVEFRIKYELVE